MSELLKINYFNNLRMFYEYYFSDQFVFHTDIFSLHFYKEFVVRNFIMYYLLLQINTQLIPGKYHKYESHAKSFEN